MDNLISRQAAIDALGGNEPVGDPSKMDDDDVVKMWERIRIINIINNLPSAQPDVPDTNVGDLISREAMGDALNRMRVGNNETWYSFYQKALDELCKLPSAQPEDCDTCKHGYFGDDQCERCRVRYPSHYERRTDEID